MTLAGLVLLGIGGWHGLAERETAVTAPSVAAQASFPWATVSADEPSLPVADDPVAPESLQALTEQLESADHTLCRYREDSQYPTSSRPLADQIDQIDPHRAIPQTLALRKAQGGVDTTVKIQTSQSRVYMAPGEAAVFTVTAMGRDNAAVPLFVTRAVARAVAIDAGPMPEQSVPFGDDGSNGDRMARDGTHSGTLAPGQTSFNHFNGTIRLDVHYSVAGQAGVVQFDVIYSPQAPATWAGPVREVVEDGSLNFYLKAQMHQAGRYIVTARVDDANSKPVALLTFNDLLEQGPNDIRLSVFGKLLRDLQPKLPLTLRDVEAYLLKEDTDPDRALMPRLNGVAHVSRTYPLKVFSDAEWQSEERDRYITEFEKDVALARAKLLEFDPEQARRPFPASACSIQRGAGRHL